MIATMPRSQLYFGACIVFFMLGLRLNAGLTVTQNVSAGATNWPGTPLTTTVTNPAVQATVGELFTSGGGNTNHSQTFSVPTNCLLMRINVYAGGGSNGTMRVKLFDLGTGNIAPNPSSYTAGTDLLGAGAGLTFTYLNQANGVLQFDFSGVDQVALLPGRMYAFEITGTLNTAPMSWYRAGADTYSGGAAYRTRAWINGSNARDFALAVYGATNSVSTNTVNTPCIVSWSDVRQVIHGFGGGTVFLNPSSLSPVTDANMNTLFGTNNASQLGLSLLRIRIDPNGSWANDLADAKKAVARGASILASPWSPPASMKDNTNLIHGSLLPAQYTNYANHLNNFANYMKTNGVQLRAISIQNEPDWDASYEGCVWTAGQLQSFCQGAAALITNAPVMMPESLNYNQAMSELTLNDPVAAANVDLVGGHLYGNGDAGATISDYPNAHNKGKPTWMTEFLVNDQTWGTAIVTAQQLHDCLTIGNMSAYIWWKTLGDANGLVNAAGAPQKRGFVMAQWSRFVRPGYYRIGVTNTASPLRVTAYKNLTNGSFAVVVINPTLTNIIQGFNLAGFNAASVTPWVTSETESLAAQSAIALTGSSFTNTFPASSVVTLVGQIIPPNTAPVFNAITSQNLNPGVMLTLTNTATDADVPAQTLVYTLLSGPTNAAFISSNGVFSWRPLVSQASSTNLITVKVADNGMPSLSATNSFSITVAPLVTPGFTAINLAGAQIQLAATGALGPDYTLLSSTNLVNWQSLLVTNPAAMPLQLSTPVTAEPQRYFRLQLGP
ncbi:MAG: hypothetical protein QM813_07350 [Verrucomicrobiota bacterium]